MSAAPFMQLYVSDYLGDTMHLTAEQHGVYLLLLMTMWRAGGTLPNDPSKLARIGRVSLKRWHVVSPDVMEFFDVDGDILTQKRLRQEYQKAVSISEKRSLSGKRGGEAKALKSNDVPLANAKQMPKHSQIPDTIKEKEEDKSSSKKTGKRLPDDFQADMLFAIKSGLSREQAKAELDKFRDYWISQPGQKGVKSDWAATWRNWCRNVRTVPARSNAPPGNRRRNYVDVARDRMNGNGPAGLFGSDIDVERVSAEQRRSGFDDDDIRGGSGPSLITSGR